PTVAATDTPTPAPSATTAAAAAKPTEAASEAATEAGTEAASITLSGLHLENAPTYKYHVTITTSGTYTSNKTFKGSLDYRVAAQKSPRVLEYDVKINEGNASNTFFKPFAGQLYIAGESTYVVIDNVLYQYGSVVSAKSTTTCQAANATDVNT